MGMKKRAINLQDKKHPWFLQNRECELPLVFLPLGILKGLFILLHCPIALLVSCLPKNYRLAFLSPILRSMLFFGGIIRIRKLFVPPKTGFFLVNHPCSLDPVVLIAAGCNGFVAKKEIIRNFLVGAVAKRLGCHFVDRSEGISENFLKTFGVSETGYLFPEGDTNRNKGLLLFSGRKLTHLKTLNMLKVSYRSVGSWKGSLPIEEIRLTSIHTLLKALANFSLIEVQLELKKVNLANKDKERTILREAQLFWGEFNQAGLSRFDTQILLEASLECETKSILDLEHYVPFSKMKELRPGLAIKETLERMKFIKRHEKLQ